MKCNEKWSKRIPDFSGKYYGKLNDKSDEKISNKCNCSKKSHQRNHSNLKGKHNRRKQRL